MATRSQAGLFFSSYTPRMTDPSRMDKVLDLLTPDEVADALHFVAVCERGQHMNQAEADEWRRRIGAWQTFLEMCRERLGGMLRFYHRAAA